MRERGKGCTCEGRGGRGARVRGEGLKNIATCDYSCLICACVSYRLNFILLLWLPMATLTRTHCAGYRTLVMGPWSLAAR